MSHTFEISLQICEGARKLHPFKLAVEMRPEKQVVQAIQGLLLGE
jgi:hypothetical protein